MRAEELELPINGGLPKSRATMLTRFSDLLKGHRRGVADRERTTAGGIPRQYVYLSRRILGELHAQVVARRMRPWRIEAVRLKSPLFPVEADATREPPSALSVYEVLDEVTSALADQIGEVGESEKPYFRGRFFAEWTAIDFETAVQDVNEPCGSLIERDERDDGIDGVKERIEAKDLTIATGWGAD